MSRLRAATLALALVFVAGTAAAQATGLPTRAPEPRTMEAYWPFFAAFALSWIGIAAYFLSLGRRSTRIARALFETR
jgi:CcmD family protein